MFILPIPTGSAAATDGQTSFLELYGNQLDRELASADRTKLFTTARRQSAINEGQREFVTKTECLQRQGTIPIVSGTAEYDVEAVFDDFTWVTKQGMEVQITSSTGVRVIGGDDLPLRSIAWLNRNSVGWRSASSGQPSAIYQREDGGHVYTGLSPAPLITAGETWALIVPYLAMPNDMGDDADGPFVVDGNTKRALWPWHKALVHYAAAQLELYRKEGERRSAVQMKIFAGYVADYIQKQRPRGGSQVQLARDYRGEARRGSSTRLNPLRDF